MGRSVSYARGAFAIAYRDCSYFGMITEDVEGNKLLEPQHDEDMAQIDWDDFIINTKAEIRAKFPKFEECDKWLDREDHAILENRYAYFGVSEYCGLVSLWLVLKEDITSYYSNADLTGIAEHWAKQVKPKFEKYFGNLRRVGTFSNGEGVYEQKTK